MNLAEDLLEQANHLARRERGKPKQASLRRAVSTAYYACFTCSLPKPLAIGSEAISGRSWPGLLSTEG